MKAIICTFTDDHAHLAGSACMFDWYLPGMEKGFWLVTDTFVAAMLRGMPPGSVHTEEADVEIVLEAAREVYGEFIVVDLSDRIRGTIDWELAVMDNGQEVLVLVPTGDSGQAMMPLSVRSVAWRVAHLSMHAAGYEDCTKSFTNLIQVAQASNRLLAEHLVLDEGDRVVRTFADVVESVHPCGGVVQSRVDHGSEAR